MAPHKILLVGPYPPPYGGLAVQLQQWQHCLEEKAGWSCQVLNIGERRKDALPGCQAVYGYLDLWNKLLKHAKQGYLIHLLTSGHNFKSWLCAFACVLAGCFNHRRSLLVFGSGNLPAFVHTSKHVTRALMMEVGRLSGHVVCRNEDMRRALVSLGIDSAKISIIHGYYTLPVTDEAQTIPREVREFLSEHHPLLGATAIMAPEYGIPDLLGALEVLRLEYPRIGLILIGLDGSLPVPINLHAHVHLPGPLANSVVLTLMKHLTVFVRPTLFDGDSLSVREALSLGVQVVASDTGHRPHGVELFKKSDTSDLIRAVRQVLTQESGNTLFEYPSTLQDAAARMLELYHILLEASPKTTAAQN